MNPIRTAMIVEADSRAAQHVRESFDRMNVTSTTMRSLAEAADHAERRPPHLLVVTMPHGTPEAAVDLAAALRARHGTIAVFVLEQVDDIVLEAALDAGALAVLCKPIHREQLEATFRFAFDQYDRDRRQAPDPRPGGP